jgi:hypothetical protein
VLGVLLVPLEHLQAGFEQATYEGAGLGPRSTDNKHSLDLDGLSTHLLLLRIRMGDERYSKSSATDCGVFCGELHASCPALRAFAPTKEEILSE